MTELGVDCGVTYGVVKQWRRRNAIPSRYWPFLIEGARRRGIEGVTAELLMSLQTRETSAAE